MPPKKAKQQPINQRKSPRNHKAVDLSELEPKVSKKVVTEKTKTSASSLLQSWVLSHIQIDQRISLDKEEMDEQEIKQEKKVKKIIRQLSKSQIKNDDNSDISADVDVDAQTIIEQKQQQKQQQKPVKKTDNQKENENQIQNEDDSDFSAQISDKDEEIQEDSDESVLSNISQDYYSFGQKKTGFQKVLLAHTWDESIDPTGKYMSEKLDGIRAYWDGKQMFSRNGNPFKYPPDFTDNWPKVPLDGELFLGRGKFQECSKIVLNRTNASQSFQKNRDLDVEAYQKIVYRVFDLPQSNLPFKDRIKILQTEIPKINSKTIKYQPHTICKGHDHLKEKLDKTLQKNGEGLMLRDPEAKYERKRSKTILKVKVFKDSEAQIIGESKGSKDSCRCFDIYDPLKKEFAIRGYYPKGKIITYKYFELTHNGIPRFPTFLRYYKKQ